MLRKVKAQKEFVDLDVLCIEMKIEILILPITLSYIVRKLFDTCVFQQRTTCEILAISMLV